MNISIPKKRNVWELLLVWELLGCQYLCLFCIWTSYLLDSDCLVLLKFYTVPMCLHTVKNFISQKRFHVNTCLLFHHENMTSFLNYSTATLRPLFAWRGSYNHYMFKYQGQSRTIKEQKVHVRWVIFLEATLLTWASTLLPWGSRIE